MPQVGNSQVGYILVEVIPGVKKKTVIINSMAYASVISSSAHRPPPPSLGRPRALESFENKTAMPRTGTNKLFKCPAVQVKKISRLPSFRAYLHSNQS